MNNLGKISIVLIAVFIAGNSMYPINQLVHAQLDILETPTNPNNTSTSSTTTTTPKAIDTQKNAKIKEALANIFEIYQVLAERGDVDSLLKLNTIERILLELLK
ncbi:hypothetical protein [Candidatus Nitrosocosmicus franklandus]|uniref:Uncharacterized protein n=1 Tax=Candidatus Nitrosocosmicus franklandianus TaxID=1798806 RepID=A0A484IDI7_9ARCH|nr:hypothetical protein [Candidatus Nitrosocosmicus franklandus]VFJ13730.1 conserved protein of unknown function [Candidatus Nitrosocosmicus franklandus]